jgi:hypothetical protein
MTQGKKVLCVTIYVRRREEVHYIIRVQAIASAKDLATGSATAVAVSAYAEAPADSAGTSDPGS